MHTHSGQLARWLGEEKVAQVSHAMRDWYGPAIALAGVPGNVWAQRGGDFTGPVRAGYEASAPDRLADIGRRLRRGYRSACRPPHGQFNTGFASLSALIAAVTQSAKFQSLAFNKVGTTGVVNATNSLFRVGAHPAAGSAAAAAAAGTAFTSSTTGAIVFTNPGGSDTTHLTTGFPISSVINNTLLLYDRLFGVAKTMNNTGTEAVTGVPTRYQSTTATDADYCGGNFLFVECGTVLPATGHNWTVCKYTNQAGTTNQTLPSLTGNSANIVNRLDHPAGQWFAPLAAGDIGIKALTQMQCSALVATGAIDFVIGRPLVWLPCWLANQVCTADNINTAFNFTRVFDSACLAFLEVCKPATTATTYTGTINIAQG